MANNFLRCTGAAVLASAFIAAGCSSEEWYGKGAAVAAGFVPVTDDHVQEMPAEKMTAVLSSDSNYRVGIAVDSPAGCLMAARENKKTQFAAGSRFDDHANCVDSNGKIPMVVIEGRPYVLGKIVTPTANP